MSILARRLQDILPPLSREAALEATTIPRSPVCSVQGKDSCKPRPSGPRTTPRQPWRCSTSPRSSVGTRWTSSGSRWRKASSGSPVPPGPPSYRPVSCWRQPGPLALVVSMETHSASAAAPRPRSTATMAASQARSGIGSTSASGSPPCPITPCATRAPGNRRRPFAHGSSRPDIGNTQEEGLDAAAGSPRGLKAAPCFNTAR